MEEINKGDKMIMNEFIILYEILCIMFAYYFND